MWEWPRFTLKLHPSHPHKGKPIMTSSFTINQCAVMHRFSTAAGGKSRAAFTLATGSFQRKQIYKPAVGATKRNKTIEAINIAAEAMAAQMIFSWNMGRCRIENTSTYSRRWTWSPRCSWAFQNTCRKDGATRYYLLGKEYRTKAAITSQHFSFKTMFEVVQFPPTFVTEWPRPV